MLKTMKKILFLLAFLVLSTIGFAQQRGNIFNVPHWNTAFGITLPKNTFVYCSDSNKIYRLKASSTSIGSLLTILNEEYPNRSTLPLYWDSINNVIFPYDTNNAVAIGTDKSAGTEMLRVRDGSVLFDGTTGTTPVSGEGTRMMWIPSKAAFRAGYVDGTQWDDSLVGDYSTAMGYSTTASGVASTAMGESTTASGDISTAMGSSTTASGFISTAIGETTTASGDFSTAMCKRTTASGVASTAMCLETTANSYALFTAGSYNDTTSSTSKDSWVSTDPLFQLGNGSSIANRNDALRILKNGTTYIGDASSTTDPIMTVSTTDSTTTVIGNMSISETATMDHLTVTDSVTLEDALFDIYHLAPDADSLVVADDGIINLRTGAYGELRVWVFNAGMYAEYAIVILNVDGSIGIMTENSTNVTNVGGTDNKLNIYDAGAYTTIENKLGGSRTIKYTFIH
jgi:hypothetical protein